MEYAEFLTKAEEETNLGMNEFEYDTKTSPKKPEIEKPSMPCKVHLGGLRFTGWNADLTLYYNGQEHRANVEFSGTDFPPVVTFDKDGYDLEDEEQRESAEQNESDLVQEFCDNAADLHFLMPLRLNDEAKKELKEQLKLTNIYGSLDDDDWWNTNRRALALEKAQIEYLEVRKDFNYGIREWRAFKKKVYATKSMAALNALIEKEKGTKK